MATPKRPLAVVTGASSGIGAATARALARAGYNVLVGARRQDRLDTLAEEIGGESIRLDVTSQESVDALAASIGSRSVEVLVNNAGAALGLEPVAQAEERFWTDMYKLNVLGVMRVTRALLPALRRGEGLLVNIGSTSGFEVYPGGGGYTASKHALRAVTRTLRLELLGEPIRVTEISPGLANTEFSEVRFSGDQERASSVYQGMTPLVAEDVAECVAFVASRPSHVNIDELVVRPRDQATSTAVHRRSQER